MLLNLYAKILTNVHITTVDVVLTLTASIQMEASVAAAETVIMETDFSVAVKLASFCITLQLAMHTNNVDILCDSESGFPFCKPHFNLLCKCNSFSLKNYSIA